jgi:hypothetical protein
MTPVDAIGIALLALGAGLAGYLGWNRMPPSNRMTSAFM